MTSLNPCRSLIFLTLFPEVINSFFLSEFQPKLSVQPDQSSSPLAHLLTYLEYFVFWFLTVEGKNKFLFSIRIHYSIGNNRYNNPVPDLTAVTLFLYYQSWSDRDLVVIYSWPYGITSRKPRHTSFYLFHWPLLVIEELICFCNGVLL